ncbi:scavenger mRNA decapping enzyme [Marasmius fiardii PR-910]|nr:scavenger mRNA decapping enzyme [Marasmius fiardii PR-910]
MTPVTESIPSLLKFFKYTRILNDEPEKCRLALLGTLPASWPDKIDIITPNSDERLQAIVRLEKTAFATECAEEIFHPEDAVALIPKTRLIGSTDIYTWLAGWGSPSASEEKQPHGDVKISIVCPATELHVRKYSKQLSILVQETPTLYQQIVEPYISSFPAARTQWVTEILEGRAEQDKILFSSPEIIILPDMKWDLHTVGSLYLVAIIRGTHLRSLRDLRGEHVQLLKNIRDEAYKVAGDRWAIGKGGLRLFIHYQPSYYHFHVHIVNASYDSGLGMIAGQAHLLEDVISLVYTFSLTSMNRIHLTSVFLVKLEFNGGIFKALTLTYGLGEQHGLYESMKAAQSLI